MATLRDAWRLQREQGEQPHSWTYTPETAKNTDTKKENENFFGKFEKEIFGIAVVSVCFAIWKFLDLLRKKKYEKAGEVPSKIELAKDLKKMWVFMFCALSLLSCLIFLPYNHHSNGRVFGETEYFTIAENKDKKYYRIDYESIAFREVLILAGCCAGYALNSIAKK